MAECECIKVEKTGNGITITATSPCQCSKKKGNMERRVFTYKDAEEASDWIGKPGIFGEILSEVAEGKGKSGELGLISTGGKNPITYQVTLRNNSFPFMARGIGYFQFFSPDPEPVEKWVPFTAEDGELFRGRWVGGKSIKTIGGSMIVSYGPRGVTLVSITPVQVDYEDLFNEYSFSDNSPCGKKIESFKITVEGKEMK